MYSFLRKVLAPYKVRLELLKFWARATQPLWWGDTYILDEFVGLEHLGEAFLGGPGEVLLLLLCGLVLLLVRFNIGGLRLHFVHLHTGNGESTSYANRRVGPFCSQEVRTEASARRKVGSVERATYQHGVVTAPSDGKDSQSEDDIVRIAGLNHRASRVDFQFSAHSS